MSPLRSFIRASKALGIHTSINPSSRINVVAGTFSFFASLILPSQAAVLVVPLEGVTFNSQERIKIVTLMKTTFGFRNSVVEESEEELENFLDQKESEYLKQKFEEAKLPVAQVNRIPDIIFDLWAIKKMFNDLRSFQHQYERKGERIAFRKFYFDMSAELIAYLRYQSPGTNSWI
jgi:hypothetical protein